MENPASEEERFFSNLKDLMALVYELAVMCWESGFKDVSPKLVEFAESFLENYDSTKIINAFIKNSHKYWGAPQTDSNGNILCNKDGVYIGKGGQIKAKSDDFFIKNAYKIFGGLPVGKDQINAIGIFFKAKDENNNYVIVKEDRDAIWNYIHSLVKIAIKYVHRQRGMKISEKSGKPVYKKDETTGKLLYPNIAIGKLKIVWNLNKLPYPTR